MRFSRTELQVLWARYLIHLEKKRASEAGIKRYGPGLVEYLLTQPGRRAVIAGWEVWLVRKKTIRARPLNPLK